MIECLFIFDEFYHAPRYVRDNYRTMSEIFGAVPALIQGDLYRQSVEAALSFFGHEDPKSWDQDPTKGSDWIRTRWMFTPGVLYSDSDVTWSKVPNLGDDPAKGDDTLGILWSGRGLDEEDRQRVSEYGEKQGWGNIPSNIVIESGKKFGDGCFSHDKPFPHPPGGYTPGHYKENW